MQSLVSVIVPVYNAEAYLPETLRSIMASTYAALEVIIMDDGSRDNSLTIAKEFAKTHSVCHVYTQPNQGVSVARNNAIRLAHGKYILPVDADDLISDTYIEHAVQAIETMDDIRVVGCHARMFGTVNREWKLPPFSHALLARKNMIPVTSLFRREDWVQVGGFCEEEIYREDWDFWLSIFELGGKYHLLDEVGLFYRILPNSRRKVAKEQKRAIVDAINRRHPLYMERHLGGPLCYHRSISKYVNLLRHVSQVGTFSDWDKGSILQRKRNTIRLYNRHVIKAFAVPSLWRGILYGWFLKSKARRSYEYAQRLGDLTPNPIAYREVRVAGVLRESYYVCEQSACPYTFNDLIGHPDFPNREQILKAIGQFTAQLHKKGIWHQDYSGGNILFNEDGSLIQIVDLNRIRWRVPHQPLQGFERLNIDSDALRTMAYAYAEVMNLDPEQTANYIIRHRWSKHVKQGITNV